MLDLLHNTIAFIASWAVWIGAWGIWFFWVMVWFCDWALRATFITRFLRILWKQEFGPSKDQRDGPVAVETKASLEETGEWTPIPEPVEVK